MPRTDHVRRPAHPARHRRPFSTLSDLERWAPGWLAGTFATTQEADTAAEPAGSARHAKNRVHTGTWHTNGMNRTRLSTTVDAELLNAARTLRSGLTDAALIDEALAALLVRYRAAEVDASYKAYDEHPANEPDEWGDLASFRQAAAAS